MTIRPHSWMILVRMPFVPGRGDGPAYAIGYRVRRGFASSWWRRGDIRPAEHPPPWHPRVQAPTLSGLDGFRQRLPDAQFPVARTAADHREPEACLGDAELRVRAAGA